ncbi:serine hydrolase [Sciscionella sediminilitoris]|uniref:serine hydrolase n=1 Tax=Sciscionella sediminilitoris TaxID=1445613 RepID=UPI0004DF6308|nr:serine hydrolase [Sciscionella sp. SE31]
MSTFDITDIAGIGQPIDLTLSPDGSTVVYVLRTADTEADENVHELWSAGTDGTPPRRIGEGTDPAISPDGETLVFLREKQLWTMPVHGGAPEQLTDRPLGAGPAVWHPDARKLAFTAAFDFRGGTAHSPIVTSAAVHKIDGGARFRGVYSQLFLLDLDSAETTMLTGGEFEAHAPAWSPDGSELAYLRGFAEDTPTARAHVLDPRDPAAPHRLVPGPVSVSALAWHGTDLLLVGEPETGVRNAVLTRVDSAGNTSVLTAELDRAVMPGAAGYPGATPAVLGDKVLYCVRDRGCTHLYRDGEPLLGGDHVVSGLAVAGGRIAVVVADPRHSGEIGVVDPETGQLRLLTGHTPEGRTPIVPVERTFTVHDGVQVHGWLVRDPELREPGPLLLDVHGGPHNAWHPALDPAHLYHQVLAARGWSVLLLNPRGSDGYGEELLRAGIGAWGTADERDFLDPVDQLVEEGIADPRRLALCGYSYGGFMACWLSTRTERFAAVVAGGVVCDLELLRDTSDIGDWFYEQEIGDSAAQSPIRHIDRVSSPTLVLHGLADQRCLHAQAELWYSGLRRRGVRTELVSYPEASHLFILDGRPAHRIDYNRRILNWVTRHTGTRVRGGADPDYWQRRLAALVEAHGVVGASLGIAIGDEISTAAAGLLHTGTGAPARTGSLFQIGSITKVYTATVIMRLVERGELGLDDPIERYVPGIAEGVTIRHLLTHTSGIDGDLFHDTGRGDDCLERYTAKLAEAARIHPIGETFSYCNAGFSLVARIAEVCTGKVWDELFGELLLEPLGLEHTVLLPEQVLRFDSAIGHVKGKDGKLAPAPQWHLPRAVAPAGAICATAEDVLRFARGQLLRPETAELMRTEQVALPDTSRADAWGLGWWRNLWDGARLIGHDGNTLGQSAFLRVLPEADIAVTLLTNGGEANPLAHELFTEIFGKFAGIAPPEPLRPSEYDTAEPADWHLGVYERAALRFEVSRREGGLHATLSTSEVGSLGEPEPPREFTLVPDEQDAYLIREPRTREWQRVRFFRLADGSAYVHFGLRATPKVRP